MNSNNDLNEGDNITFSFNENDIDNVDNIELQNILNEFHEGLDDFGTDYIPTQYPLNVFTSYYDFDEKVKQTLNYNINYTVKQLMDICDYYEFLKRVKTGKFNKEQIIDEIIDFEFNPENEEIVVKRKMMWYYIKELKNDKFMKKFVIWSNK